MEAKVFQIRLITNLHMGSGETNFNFIDNQIQRDPVTEYPNMHSSGIKGALREFFSGNDSVDKTFVDEIFGKENTSDSSTQGGVSFIEGKLLAIPARSNKKSYYMATTLEIIREYIEFNKIFNNNFKSENIEKELKEIEKKFTGKVKACILGKKIIEISVEGLEENEIEGIEGISEIEKVLGISDIIILKEEVFKNEISRKMPIMARNRLENGISQNLWYEEVVPRETIFYTGIINSQKKKEFGDLCEKLEENIIQIGANATIGYGLTQFIGVTNNE